MLSTFHIDLLTLPVGVALLVFGRKLFWFFVGGIGFLSGMHIATGTLYGQTGWAVLLIALVSGCVGAIVAVFLQRFAVVLSGFLAGSYLTAHLITLWGWQIGPFLWLAMMVFGILGAVAGYRFFDWALIVISALTGAAVISESLSLSAALSTLLMTLFFALGVAAQAGFMKRDRSRSPVSKTTTDT